MTLATLSLGANLADKREAIAEAVERLRVVPGIRILARSADYRTPPWGKTDQDWFVNAAVKIETSLAPEALLAACLAVEAAMGRKRAERWGPRRIDIDIISYGALTIDKPGLRLPHPHAAERAFVLVPLAEIAPDIAVGRTTAHQALARLDRTGIEPLPAVAPPEAPQFDRAFTDPPGVVTRLSPRVRRIVAPNPGPYTFTGTCTYIIGEGRVTVLDPGPNDPAHIEAILATLGGETIERILVSHTHKDHSPGAAPLKALTDAPVEGCGPHRAARPLHPGETTLEAGADRSYAPDRQIHDGERFGGAGYTLAALATPGHTANHLCFALEEDGVVFSGDHVMGWSTTVVAPPDGSMRDFMASLEQLKMRPEALFLPGHGGPITQPQRFVRALIHHRRMREAAILGQVRGGIGQIADLVPRIYENLNPALVGGAAMSILSHLEDLAERGLVVADGPATLKAHYRAS
ncbi:MAG TPA: 2-amino-4-hydroxy-6-hydroxymethyldihydropteridine diphosphokinase [Beijerinckiaceae bacterium]|nr:2-amino-4-hydroxy-6-hydroxymethyldihydropteridine diphosphokinase [Beijerinckiaceae bacterium]